MTAKRVAWVLFGALAVWGLLTVIRLVVVTVAAVVGALR